MAACESVKSCRFDALQQVPAYILRLHNPTYYTPNTAGEEEGETLHVDMEQYLPKRVPSIYIVRLKKEPSDFFSHSSILVSEN